MGTSYTDRVLQVTFIRTFHSASSMYAKCQSFDQYVQKDSQKLGPQVTYHRGLEEGSNCLLGRAMSLCATGTRGQHIGDPGESSNTGTFYACISRNWLRL